MNQQLELEDAVGVGLDERVCVGVALAVVGLGVVGGTEVADAVEECFSVAVLVGDAEVAEALGLLEVV